MNKTWSANDFPLKEWDKSNSFEFKNYRWIYNWFSNFEPSPFWVDNAPFSCDDIIFKSVENYYQACKANNRNDFRDIALAPIAKSKKMGRQITVRPDWEEVKWNFMWRGLCEKFQQNKAQKEKLLLTIGDIVEWNNWNDKIWGASIKDGLGQNALGIMLMELRTILSHG
jgi:ribA/ribD-fused uncharacterized protein